jgi:hypothetical protein
VADVAEVIAKRVAGIGGGTAIEEEKGVAMQLDAELLEVGLDGLTARTLRAPTGLPVLARSVKKNTPVPSITS